MTFCESALKGKKMDNDCEYCKHDSCELCLNNGYFITCEWVPFNGEVCEHYEKAAYCRRCGKKLKGKNGIANGEEETGIGD